MEPGTLYVVSTPVGNLADITLRALEVLQQVDVIAAEDTRHTGMLLRRHGITAHRMMSYHEHNETRRASQLVALLEGGADVALVSNAGTPAISDPGYRVITSAGERGIAVVPIPGPSALLAALYRDGAIVLGSGDRSVRFRPHLTISREELDQLSDLLHTSVRSCLA